MQGADKGIEQELDGLGLHIGIVQARFNEGITNALAVACIRELEELGVHDIDHVLVPGALEVPIALQAMAMACNAMGTSKAPGTSTWSMSWTPNSSSSRMQATAKALVMPSLKRACTMPMCKPKPSSSCSIPLSAPCMIYSFGM